ncbi:hypothetical protein OOT46_28615 [Aquabacterium sp. A7-Y]|uniref:hypothetical protein n=1 Tax=Aquabacterium sp. A7-Y TaxID=1349605 RepID=UPI00223E20EF|nr:hypothetical protein [Aquabacterium sp. A7-Y]MCW7541765.1 hypothetical protein [Aquabacterium sp. A7-Y]
MTTASHHAARRYVVAAAAALLALSVHAAPTYRIVLLEFLPGFEDSSSVEDLNNHGQIVGFSYLRPNFPRAVVWDRDGRVQPLRVPLPGSTEPGWAWGNNQRGQIVGGNLLFLTNRGYEHAARAVLWLPGGRMQVLPSLSLPGAPYGWAYARAINDHGDAVGESNFKPVLWEAGRGVRDLGALPTYPEGEGSATAINNAKQVVGVIAAIALPNWQFINHAFIWSEATGMQDLGARLGPPDMRSWASAINDRGQVVGATLDSEGRGHAFVWSEHEGLVRLGGPGDTESFASDINNAGVVVGSVNGEAVLWSRGEGLQKIMDLVDPADPLKDQVSLGVHDINDLGEIAGTIQGDFINWWWRAVLLIPQTPARVPVRAAP